MDVARHLGAVSSGAVVLVIQREFGITQAAVSQHLRVLRESGFATVRAAGSRRMYTINAAPFAQIDEWLNRFRVFWTQNLDALTAGSCARKAKKARRFKKSVYRPVSSARTRGSFVMDSRS